MLRSVALAALLLLSVRSVVARAVCARASSSLLPMAACVLRASARCCSLLTFHFPPLAAASQHCSLDMRCCAATRACAVQDCAYVRVVLRCELHPRPLHANNTRELTCLERASRLTWIGACSCSGGVQQRVLPLPRLPDVLFSACIADALVTSHKRAGGFEASHLVVLLRPLSCKVCSSATRWDAALPTQ